MAIPDNLIVGALGKEFTDESLQAIPDEERKNKMVKFVEENPLSSIIDLEDL